MPHLAFYAGPNDIVPIIEFVLSETACVVYESYSVPDESLRTFDNPTSVLATFGDGSRGLQLMLHAPNMQGTPLIERFELTLPGNSWRERISGWGLIQLHFGAIRNNKLKRSDTNHNSEARARAWESTCAAFGPVAAWDFKEVASISRRINRHVAMRLACRKEGSRVVLPDAQALLDAGLVVLGAA